MSMLLGHKLGMTRIFTDSGKSIPVTMVEAGPCTVLTCKSLEKDGYNAVQIGYGEIRKNSKAQKDLPKHVKEFRLNEAENTYEIGQILDATHIPTGSKLKVTSTSKGKGFSGVIKRHNFAQGPKTHGSDHHRHPGSIGSMFPQHVFKGKKMPGRMGDDQVTIRGVEVVETFPDKNLIALKGAIPGIKGTLVIMSTLD